MLGFGNFLRFPIQAIQNGGGLYYSVFGKFCCVGAALLLIEWSIGRYGGIKVSIVLLMLQSMDKRQFGNMSEFLEFLAILNSLLLLLYGILDSCIFSIA